MSFCQLLNKDFWYFFNITGLKPFLPQSILFIHSFILFTFSVLASKGSNFNYSKCSVSFNYYWLKSSTNLPSFKLHKVGTWQNLCNLKIVVIGFVNLPNQQMLSGCFKCNQIMIMVPFWYRASVRHRCSTSKPQKSFYLMSVVWNGATTLSITTFSIMTLSITIKTWHLAHWHVIVMLRVI